jgi:hypothetical protein
MKSLVYLCTSKNGPDIYYDPVDSHAATHFNDAPGLQEIVKDLLQRHDIQNEYEGFDIDAQTVVGVKDVVDVNEGDELIYAKRINRNEHVPFVMNRKPQPCSIVSIALRKYEDGKYELESAWIGEFDSPPFPEEGHATPDSVPFWDKHAFVWRSQGVQEDSITHQRPW